MAMAKSDRKIRQIVMMMVEMILDGGGGDVLSHVVCLLVTAERLKYLLSFNHLSCTFFILSSIFYHITLYTVVCLVTSERLLAKNGKLMR